MSGQGNELRELLAMRGERFTPNDCPRIGDFDALLEALRREHDEPISRTDLDPRTGAQAPADGATVRRSISCAIAGLSDALAPIWHFCRLRRDRLETAQDRRRVCDHARDHRLDMAVGRGDHALRRAP